MPRKNTPVGTGRVSQSLGAADPRARRNADTAQNTPLAYHRTLRVDNRGRVGLNPARLVEVDVLAPGHYTENFEETSGERHAALVESHNALVVSTQSLLDAHAALLDALAAAGIVLPRRL